jgi:hypothetical protein
VVTFVLVLFLSIGTAALHQFWQVAGRQTTTSSGLLLSQRARAPEALVWLNPFVANLDMVCATAPDAYHQSCEYISSVTGRPYFGSPTLTTPVFPGRDGGGVVEPGVIVEDADSVEFVLAEPVPECPPDARCALPGGAPGFGIGAPGNPGTGVTTNEQVTFGFPRDTFWPKSAVAFVILGIVLTLISAQLVSPTRRLHLPRLRRRARTEPPADQSQTTDQTPEATI